MNKVDLSKYDNSWYNPGKNGLIRTIWYFTNLIFINSNYFPFGGVKKNILKLFGAKIGKGVVLSKKVNIKYPWKLVIKDSAWIGEEVWIDNLDKVVIGKNVCISQGAMLLCGNHNYKSKTFDLITRPITIEDGAWIGAKSVVCPGVKVNKNAILTVSSIATNDLEENYIYQGNPAARIKIREIS